MTQPDTEPRGNSRGSRRFCLTVNNWSEEEYKSLKDYFDTKATQYIIGKEVGESGTPHLQAYCEFKNAVRYDTIKKISERAHIEKAKGGKKANYEYCSKDGNYETNMPEDITKQMLNEYKGVIWKGWQQEIIDLVATKPDSRTIQWIVDPIGNSGKTYLTKYLCLKDKQVILTAGKSADSLNQVKTFMENSLVPSVIILDIPRCNEGYVSYGAIEQLKNGIFYSGKYEGGMCIFPNPHVIVFANFSPDFDRMSSDRWNVKNLE